MRNPVQVGVLKFSQGEDLRRTLVGDSKAHTPDKRYNFGAGIDALDGTAEQWGDLHWIRCCFEEAITMLTELMKVEIGPLARDEPPGTLGAMVANGREYWAGSRLRHCLYPPSGSCTEHTDYGVITLQQSTAVGFQGKINGTWQNLQPPDGTALVLAGDMLERMTNGKVRALLHRVVMSPTDVDQTPQADVMRQSHIIFLQPDRNTLVQPLLPHIRGDGRDMAPIRYGDWHRTKTSLAFARPS